MRPPLDRELRGFRPYAPATASDPSGRTITLSENLRAADNNGVENGMVYNTYRFAFDRVYAPETPQQSIYEESARGAVTNVLQGYNASIVAFGQTGAGKTHTMTGALSGQDRGIIPRAVDDVFSHIQHGTGERCKFLVRASYLQIYNEVISDLLKPEATNLAVREDKRRGVHVDGLSEWVVRTPADVYALMERGAAARATGATKLNELSSRSHAIFILIVEKSSLEVDDSATAADVEQQLRGGGGSKVAAVAATIGGSGGGVRQTVRVGKLNLVDLAGSERVHLTGAKGKRLEESKKINQSLSALGNVIAALTDPKGRHNRPHIPYRDSKLTRILEDSLGGNCKTTFMAMVSPAVEAFAESLSTLKFAHRAKCMVNAPRVNEDLDNATLLRKYEKELRKLRAELQQRSKDLVDRRLVLQIDEARRREQADKIAAITALERQSAEIARQKAAMATLQNRIASMQSQLLIGGQNVEDTPEFRTLLAAEQSRIREQYAVRLAELENERRSVAEDRAAAERLKSLLVKQRDVMVALTQRLAERDAEVLQLQGAVEVAEGRAKEAEDSLDKKMAELIAARKSTVLLQGSNNHRNLSEESGGGADADDIGGGGGGDDGGEHHRWKILASPGKAVEPTAGRDRDGPLEVVEIDSTTSGGDDDDDDDNDVESLTLDVSLPSPQQQDDDDDDGGAVEDISKKHQSPPTPPGDGMCAEEKRIFRFILEKKVLHLVGEVQRSAMAGEHTSGDGSGGGILGAQLDLLAKIVSQTVDALKPAAVEGTTTVVD